MFDEWESIRQSIQWVVAIYIIMLLDYKTITRIISDITNEEEA